MSRGWSGGTRSGRKHGSHGPGRRGEGDQSGCGRSARSRGRGRGVVIEALGVQALVVVAVVRMMFMLALATVAPYLQAQGAIGVAAVVVVGAIVVEVRAPGVGG